MAAVHLVQSLNHSYSLQRKASGGHEGWFSRDPSVFSVGGFHEHYQYGQGFDVIYPAFPLVTVATHSPKCPEGWLWRGSCGKWPTRSVLQHVCSSWQLRIGSSLVKLCISVVLLHADIAPIHVGANAGTGSHRVIPERQPIWDCSRDCPSVYWLPWYVITPIWVQSVTPAWWRTLCGVVMFTTVMQVMQHTHTHAYVYQDAMTWGNQDKFQCGYVCLYMAFHGFVRFRVVAYIQSHPTTTLFYF